MLPSEVAAAFVFFSAQQAEVRFSRSLSYPQSDPAVFLCDSLYHGPSFSDRYLREMISRDELDSGVLGGRRKRLFRFLGIVGVLLIFPAFRTGWKGLKHTTALISMGQIRRSSCLDRWNEKLGRETKNDSGMDECDPSSTVASDVSCDARQDVCFGFVGFNGFLTVMRCRCYRCRLKAVSCGKYRTSCLSVSSWSAQQHGVVQTSRGNLLPASQLCPI